MSEINIDTSGEMLEYSARIYQTLPTNNNQLGPKQYYLEGSRSEVSELPV